MLFKCQCEAYMDYLARTASINKKILSKMPKGKVYIKTGRGKKYFYIVKGNKKISGTVHPEILSEYLKRDTISDLTQKIENNYNVIQRMLQLYLPINIDQQAEIFWNKLQPYQNHKYEQNLTQQYKGHLYRSKSEIVIISMLESFNIEVKYEAALTIDGRIYYPDFVLKSLRDGRIIIWEHFGRIDDEDYVDNVISKLARYHKAGYNLWDNLIISFDRYGGGINVDTISKIIKTFLL